MAFGRSGLRTRLKMRKLRKNLPPGWTVEPYRPDDEAPAGDDIHDCDGVSSKADRDDG